MYSSHKEILFGTPGRAALAKGVDILANAVAATLGPKGRNVLIEQSYGPPRMTKDGVSVAKSIVLEDKFENLGARLVQEVANKTNEVGAGVNPNDLRRGVQQAVDLVVSYLKVGKEGVITVQEGKTLVDELEITEGMRFDRGYISPYFITNPKSQKVEFEKPLILLSERKISSLQDLLPAMEVAAQSRRPLLVVAEDIDGEALAACILNKLRGQLSVACVKAPGFGDNRKSILHDIGILTGATVFSDEVDVKLEKCTLNDLGSAGLATIGKDDTIFLNGAGAKDAVVQRADQIRNLIANTTSDYEKEKLQERLAKLSGGVAVIKVGGASELEVGEKKDRFVDALNATRAAVEEGIVPGGGTALLKASKVLTTLQAESFDQGLGIDIVKKAIAAPAQNIVNNAGEVGAVVVGRILDGYNIPKDGLKDNDQVSFNFGYDAQNGIASLLTTTEVIIAEVKKEGAMPQMPGMGGKTEK
ncbi:chaperonin [Kappamyces sp. JEL0680]|nr:chaperonin [Kappamyces sp. JEL0680]